MQLPEQIDATDIRAADGLYAVLVSDEPLRAREGHPVPVSSWEWPNTMANQRMAEAVLDRQRLPLCALYGTQRPCVAARLRATTGAILQHPPGDLELHADPDPALA